MTIKFQDLLDRVRQLKRDSDELTSAVYTVMPSTFGDLELYFICYFDTDSEKMRYTITDVKLGELKLLSDLPNAALIAYSDFVRTVEAWTTEGGPFPYSEVSGTLPERACAPSDYHIDGDEGQLL